MKNEFFPCLLVAHDDKFSVICSDFHYFDAYFGEKGGGGYAVERLAKKLLKENQIKGIKFDSEAGMFCAYSSDRAALLQLCELLRQITGEEENHRPKADSQPKIPLEQAERLLLCGFVLQLDVKAQQEFLKNVPFPTLSPVQKSHLDAVKHGTDEEKIQALKRIDAEARTKTRKQHHYLSHPDTITILLAALDDNPSDKVREALIGALRFICDRHLPDLRCFPYFLSATESKKASLRQQGIYALSRLNHWEKNTELLEKLAQDKSEKVREAVKMYVRWLSLNKGEKTFPVWMFDENLVEEIRK